MVTEIDGCDANISCRVLHAFYHHRLMRVFAFQLMHLSLLTDWNCSEGPLNWTASISWGFSAKFYPKVRENGCLDCNHVIYCSDFMADGQRFGMRGRRGGSNHSEQHQCHSFSPLLQSTCAPTKTYADVFVGACLAILVVMMFSMIMKPTNMINASDGDECDDDDDDDDDDGDDGDDEHNEYDDDNDGVEHPNADTENSQDSIMS